MHDRVDTITILRNASARAMTKSYRFDPSSGSWSNIGSYPLARGFTMRVEHVNSLLDLEQFLRAAAEDKANLIIRGSPNEIATASLAQEGVTLRRNSHFDAVPRRWAMFDIDEGTAPGFDIRKDPAAMVSWVVRTSFPPEFQNTRLLWQLSSSAGMKDPEAIKVHIWAWLSRPVSEEELKAWCLQRGIPADLKVFQQVQVHYIAPPVLLGGEDPCSSRWGILHGEFDQVEVPPIDVKVAKDVAKELGIDLEDIVQGRDVSEILAQMGDGDGLRGFHAVIRSAVMKWTRTTPPAVWQAERESLKSMIRAATNGAPRRPGRSAAEVINDYCSDAYLDNSIDGAIRKLRAVQAAAQDFPTPVSLAEAEAKITSSLQRFFSEVLPL